MPNPRRTAENAVLDTHDLVVAYSADINRTSSMTTIRSWGARWFLRHVGTIEAWESMPTIEQIALGEPTRRFVLWLIVTGRARSSVEYLDQERPGLGRVAKTIYPEYYERFVATALKLSYSRQTALDAWVGLCRIAAINRVSAMNVNGPMVEAARDTLADVSRRYYCVATLLYQLEQIPQLPDRKIRFEKPRFPGTWDKVPEPMRSTMQRFVTQTELTRRPATAKSYGLSFRDFGCWIASAYPDVTSIGQLRRAHIEAFKIWLTRERGNYSYPDEAKQLKNDHDNDAFLISPHSSIGSSKPRTPTHQSPVSSIEVTYRLLTSHFRVSSTMPQQRSSCNTFAGQKPRQRRVSSSRYSQGLAFDWVRSSHSRPTASCRSVHRFGCESRSARCTPTDTCRYTQT